MGIGLGCGGPGKAAMVPANGSWSSGMVATGGGGIVNPPIVVGGKDGMVVARGITGRAGGMVNSPIVVAGKDGMVVAWGINDCVGGIEKRAAVAARKSASSSSSSGMVMMGGGEGGSGAAVSWSLSQMAENSVRLEWPRRWRLTALDACSTWSRPKVAR